MKKLVNLTPHDIRFQNEKGEVETLPKPDNKDKVCRVENHQEKVGEINGVPVMNNRFGEIIGLPDPQEDTFFVVSLVIQQVNAKMKKPRTDLIGPDMSQAGCVRNEKGEISYVKRWCKEF